MKTDKTELEIWKDIVGFEGYYEVSNTGKVKNIKTGKVLYGSNHNGYIRFFLSVGFFSKKVFGHVLVARAFLENPSRRPQINHKNGIRDDNRLENLEWCTNAENVKHSFDVLKRTVLKGERNGFAKITEQIVRDIRIDYKTGNFTQRELAKKYVVSQPTIEKVVNRKYWNHVE